MKIVLERIDNYLKFKAENESGQSLILDGRPAHDELKEGLSPMQAVLAAHLGCSSIDVVSILTKQHQDIESFKCYVVANRETGKDANVFTDICLSFEIRGKDLDTNKVERAVQLSVEKYCSVGKILEPTAKIRYKII